MGTGPSQTALLVALARAHLTRRGVLNDPYARRVLPVGLRMVEAAARLPGLRRVGRQSVAYLGARTLFYDAFVNEAIAAGVRQIVICGAGYDSRAWRFATPDVRFFEVDLPATQADKRRRFPTGGPTYVAADLLDPELAERLGDAGFDPSERTAFTLEGVTMYLAGEDVARLLLTLAGLGGPEAVLAVNFGIGFERRGTRRGRAGRGAGALAGERFLFRLEPYDAERFLAESGWSLDELVAGPELGRRYLDGHGLALHTLNPGAFVARATRAAC